MNRRALLTSALFAIAGPRLPLFQGATPAEAEEKAPNPAWHQGISQWGDLRYPSGFAQFDYVNANAPKGGSVRQTALGTYDNFNMVVAGVKGSLATNLDLIYDTLLVPALDEVSSSYGLIAEGVSAPDDFSSVSFRLRPEAQWHDGSPVTADDVIFSYEAFKTYNPQYAAHYRRIAKVAQTGDREVTFVFDAPGNHDLPQIIGQLAIMPKAWWEGTNPDGNKRNIGSTTLEPPLSSGPYRIRDFSPGRNIFYERMKDYWGAAINVNVGRNNFDELRFEYFRDSTTALESFKGDALDWRTENSAKNWATAYDFPAVTNKRVILEEFPIRNLGMMQAFAFNVRRSKFQDQRVRRAFNHAFDFEQVNKQIFYGQYKRIASYFEGTELAATGLPNGRELELLETVRDKVPAELFLKTYSNPINATPQDVHDNLRESLRLLNEAGYVVRDQTLVHAKSGDPFVVELLTADPNFERVYMFFSASLRRLGMAISVRTVDAAQYQNRLRNRDFDIVSASWPESMSPGNEERGYWGSRAAREPGSLNLIGIENPAVDAMIDQITLAKTRPDLEAATKALDRILLWNHYVVPQWSYGKVRTARWDRFGRPDPLPKYGTTGFPALWWWDANKAVNVGSR